MEVIAAQAEIYQARARLDSFAPVGVNNDYIIFENRYCTCIVESMVCVVYKMTILTDNNVC